MKKIKICSSFASTTQIIISLQSHKAPTLIYVSTISSYLAFVINYLLQCIGKDIITRSIKVCFHCLSHNARIYFQLQPRLNPVSRRTRHFVPNESKDEYYWQKRRKNNEAARKYVEINLPIFHWCDTSQA